MLTLFVNLCFAEDFWLELNSAFNETSSTTWSSICPEDRELESPEATIEARLPELNGIFHLDFALSGLVGDRTALDGSGGDCPDWRELFPLEDSFGNEASSAISSMDWDMLLPGLLSAKLPLGGRETTSERQGSEPFRWN
jgi:hypothetical protein